MPAIMYSQKKSIYGRLADIDREAEWLSRQLSMSSSATASDIPRPGRTLDRFVLRLVARKFETFAQIYGKERVWAGCDWKSHQRPSKFAGIFCPLSKDGYRR